jgi:hypothetical protein
MVIGALGQGLPRPFEVVLDEDCMVHRVEAKNPIWISYLVKWEVFWVKRYIVLVKWPNLLVPQWNGGGKKPHFPITNITFPFGKKI